MGLQLYLEATSGFRITFFVTILKISSLFFTISKIKIAMPDFNLTFFHYLFPNHYFYLKLKKKNPNKVGEAKSKGPGDAAVMGKQFLWTKHIFFSQSDFSAHKNYYKSKTGT